MPADHTHSPAPEDIMEYLDGEGTDASRATIAAHLASCAACRTVAAEQRGMSDAARAWEMPPAPPSLRAPAARVRRFPTSLAAWRPSRFVLAGFSAAAALLVVIAFGVREKTAMSRTERAHMT